MYHLRTLRSTTTFGFRLFANLTQAELLRLKLNEHKSINRYSPEDTCAWKLIDFVTAGKYDNALKLVKEENVHPDAHTWNENTAYSFCYNLL
jgi:hypothetical protein